MRDNATLREETLENTGSPSLGRAGAAVRRSLTDGFEHGSERIPLLGPLPNELLEAMHDPLHEILFALAVGPRQGRLEVNVMAV